MKPIEGESPDVSIWTDFSPKHSDGGEVKNVSVLVTVNEESYRGILRVAEGTKEDKASWRNFLRDIKERSLSRPRFDCQ